MKKVGILTFHRANNYGAVLQCYALQEYISRQGFEVEIIDYKQAFIEKVYNHKFNLLNFATSCLKLRCFKYFRNLKYKRQKEECFLPFRSKFLNIRTIFGNNIPQDYDVYIIGSDQMWSYQCVHGYEPIYWGNFKRSKQSRLYGFSISGNGDFKGRIDDHEIIKNINQFDGISFREEKIRDIVTSLVNKHYPLTIDPTLLTESEFWEKIINTSWQNRKYLVFYQVRNAAGKESLVLSKAKKLAEQNNLEFINLNDGTYSVEDFVSVIKYAQYVITTSFHATSFSLIFRVPFMSVVLNDGHDDRYVDLLKSMDLSERIVQYDEEFEIKMDLDNVLIDKNLEKNRKSSVDYITKILYDTKDINNNTCL